MQKSGTFLIRSKKDLSKNACGNSNALEVLVMPSALAAVASTIFDNSSKRTGKAIEKIPD
jgi:hypothetical protein